MAKRYQFRFETLLSVRRQLEEEQKRIVASRLRKIHHLERRQRTLLGRLDEQLDLMRQTLGDDVVNLDQLKMGRGWIIRLRRGILEADAEIAAHKASLAQERVGLAKSVKDRSVLSRLKERRYHRYLAEMDHREQAESDEMAILRFAHRDLQLSE